MPYHSKLKTILGVASAALFAGIAAEGSKSLEYYLASKRLISESERFPREYEVGAGDEFVYFSLGDSTAQGVGALVLSESLPYQIASRIPNRRVKVVNLAQSGATIEDVLNTQVAEIPPGPIDLVTVSISANDVTRDTHSGVYRLVAKALLNDLVKLQPTRIVLSTTPNFGETPAIPGPCRRVLQKRAKFLAKDGTELFKSFPTLRWADLYSHGTILASEYSDDGFHPSGKGYSRWAELFATAALKS